MKAKKQTYQAISKVCRRYASLTPYLHNLNGLNPYILNLDHQVQAISTDHLRLPSMALNMHKHFDQSNHFADQV